MLNQNTDKALKRSKNGTMQHYRCFTLAMLVNKLGAKTSRHGEVDLNGAALPDTTKAVTQGEFYFRAIESPLTRQFLPVESCCVQCISQRLLRLVPTFV